VVYHFKTIYIIYINPIAVKNNNNNKITTSHKIPFCNRSIRGSTSASQRLEDSARR
jgi:hypothetical protein